MPIAGDIILTKKEVEIMVLDFLQREGKLDKGIDCKSLSSDFIYSDGNAGKLAYTLRFNYCTTYEV